MEDLLNCEHEKQCGGCPLYALPYGEQLRLKRDHLHRQWGVAGLAQPLPDVDMRTVGSSGLRDRTDLTHHQDGVRRLGLYDHDRREIVDLQNCLQMSSALKAWHRDFKACHIPVPLGSIRLRVGPNGLRGAWLDFSNINVKTLFDEKTSLRALLQKGVIEVGQRRKVLQDDGERLRLHDPVPQPWFQTYVGPEGKPVPLSCSIADFTQPSMLANAELVKMVMTRVREAQPHRLVEFGSGIGNFTLPLAYEAENMSCYEIDPHSVRHLQLNLEQAGLAAHVKIERGDYQKPREGRRPDFFGAHLIFVDPPRTGLKDFLAPLEELSKGDRPEHFLYVSCFAESFCADAARLEQAGYQLRYIGILDQFPQSHHFEMVAHFVQV